MATDILQYAYAGDIVKAERDPEGNLMVFGKATGPDVDLDGQVADPTWLKQAMPEWAKWGNLREMHQPIVAGIGREISQEGDDWYLKSEVVDAGTARKIEAGALKGYSIGIKNAIVQKYKNEPDRIMGGTIVEVSYVDRPCNPTSTIGIAKAAGADDVLTGVESPTPGTSWLAKKSTQTAKQDGDNSVATASDIQKPSKNDPCCPLCAGSGKFDPKANKKGKKHEGMKSADADLLKRVEDLEKKLQASGRSVDSSGRDTSDLDESDYAGPNHTFPIVNQDDVHDAASLAHHAANPAAVRAKIRSIARRKFQMKDNELPPTVRKGKKSATKAVEPDLKKMVKKAVKSETAALTARAEAAEAKLETLSKTVVPGGPRTMGFPAKTDETAALKARVERYKQMASDASDRELSRGYEDLAKKVEADIAKMA